MSDISKLSSAKLLQNMQNTKTENPEAKVREVADLYEKYFVKEMMRHMRSTVQEGGFLKVNNAEKIFREQLDDQYSSEANKRGGFGVSDLIYQQLTEKFGSQMGLEKPQGPLSPDLNMEFKELTGLPHQKKTQQTAFMVSAHNAVSENAPAETVNVQNPWAGVLQNKNRLEGDRTSYEIKHDNGLESLILTQGAPTAETQKLSAGDKLAAGQSLGLARSTGPLVWTIKSSVSE